MVGKIPQAYITIKKKHENIGFKKAFHQCSFTISDVTFGHLKIYIRQNIEISILINLSDIETKNTDPVSIFFILKVKVSVRQVSQDNLGHFSG